MQRGVHIHRHPEVSLHHVGPDSDHSFPPGPAPPRGGPKQLPPSAITPVSSQDKLPPLLNQDENYVIPIGDDPAANYVNGDGGWRPGWMRVGNEEWANDWM